MQDAGGNKTNDCAADFLGIFTASLFIYKTRVALGYRRFPKALSHSAALPPPDVIFPDLSGFIHYKEHTHSHCC